MKTYELVFTILSAILFISTVISLVSWFILIRREKHCSPVFSLSSLLINLFLIAVFSFCGFMAEKSFCLFWMILVATEVVSLPTSTGSVITEKGLCTFAFGFKKLIAAESVKYQYKDKNLELYPNNMKRVYRFNINNIKTVKLLADWYPKYGYTNPLTDQNNDQ